ncbi:MAG: hypothetical protein K0R57_4782 [Paenibacillaceae bacterium]|jgi:hypothetical protein|nr:hypothetical protein [Paenibacillaceae bacterium]
MSSNPKRKIAGFTEVNEVPLATILVHCRTVVEKKDFVSTGIMTFAEGDLLEVEINDYAVFNLGENVKLTVYTPIGIYIITSTIIGKDTGSLMMINPPENQRRFLDKREYPRVEVDRSGVLASLAGSLEGDRHVLSEPVPLQLRNISLSGIGFTASPGLLLDTNTHVEIELDLGTIIPCVAEIMRTERESESLYYGARYVRMADDKMNSLRAFILREQISAHYATKQIEDRKRLFK